MKTRFAACSLILMALSAQPVWAAISEPDAAKAAEAKAKTAWTAKVTAYQLCAAQDKVVAQYHARLAAEGKNAPEPIATADCMNPGPFSYAPDQSTQPREGSGAHSPAETAKQPPSSPTPEAADKPLSK